MTDSNRGSFGSKIGLILATAGGAEVWVTYGASLIWLVRKVVQPLFWYTSEVCSYWAFRV